MYIVTGGAGFIGSAVVWGLNQRGIDNILIVDHLGTADKWKNLRSLEFSDYMEKDDFRDRFLNNKIDTIEAIIHLGACSSTTETDASYLIDNNFKYSKELAKYAVSREIRFIYASSSATYGDGAEGYRDDVSELNNLRPLNAYGYSKHMFDLWARNNGMLRIITGLKYTNIFGPNEWHKEDMRSVVCKAYQQIKETGSMKLFKSHNPEFKDGEQQRDFLYIKDAVEMTLFFLECYDGGIFNIGSGKAETWNSLTTAVFKAMDLEPKIEYIDMPEAIRNRYQYYTKAEMERLNNAGFTMVPTPLEKAVEDYVKNYLIPEKYLGDK